ncbi:DUF6243 family protein [Streptomyces gobiensis]|uniref:DUF6243 family protein n=1 Tax=Streptomyces gobiensis TaxID=2875706 RepID=UPI001E542E15|nr:DUF6243 family protein [Streptomyces gobiensis]UGY91081.1 DUF6243 family protein [Streptomyces gobiensis]
MSKGRAGNMLGVGGTRSHLSRKAIHGGSSGSGGRGGGRGGRGPGGGTDPMAQKRELLRKLQESRE